jgi:hypothetical protein
MKTAVDQLGREQALTWERATRMVRWSLFFSVCGLATWSLISWATSLPYAGWYQWLVVAIGVGFGVASNLVRDAV